MRPSSSPLYALAAAKCSANVTIRRPRPCLHSNTKHAKQKSGISYLTNDPYVTDIRQFSLMASTSHSVPPVSCMSSHGQVQTHSSSTSKKESGGAPKSSWASVNSLFISFALVYLTEHRRLSFKFAISTPSISMTYFG